MAWARGRGRGFCSTQGSISQRYYRFQQLQPFWQMPVIQEAQPEVISEVCVLL